MYMYSSPDKHYSMYMFVCIYTHIHIHIYIIACICLFAYIYIYIYIHIHYSMYMFEICWEPILTSFSIHSPKVEPPKLTNILSGYHENNLQECPPSPTLLKHCLFLF